MQSGRGQPSGSNVDTVSGPWAQPTSARAKKSTWSTHQSASYLNAFDAIKRTTDSTNSSGPLRVVFLGQRVYFGPTSLPRKSPGLEATFVDHTWGEDPADTLQAISSIRPHLVVAYRPEKLGDVLTQMRDVLRIGFFPEPAATPGGPKHPDLNHRLAELQEVDPNSCDIFFGFNPLFADAWNSVVDLAGCMPLPVRDDIYIDPNRIGIPSTDQGIFVGRVTDRRNDYLLSLKHHFNWTVVDHGLRSLADISIAVNLRNENYPNYENRVSLHLARGHLLLTEPVQPTYELHEGLNLLNFASPQELLDLARSIEHDAEPFHPIAIRGRLSADSFRATSLWPDRFVDLAASL